MDEKNDYYFNRCPIKISFTIEYDLFKATNKTKYVLKFEIIKNSIAEVIKEPKDCANKIVEKIKDIKPDDNEICTYQRMHSDVANRLKYGIVNLELDFGIPKLFRILLISSENENIKATYTFSIVDLFLHSFDENYLTQDVLFDDIQTKPISSNNYSSSIIIRLKQKIKYPKTSKDTEPKTYVTQKVSKFVKTTTCYDVTVNRHDFGWIKSLFSKPYTQLKVCVDKKPIYESPIFVNALYFKIDSFNILTSKYIDNNGIPLVQEFCLVDWSRSGNVISTQKIIKQEKNDKEATDQDNQPKDKKIKKDKDKGKDKYFSIEKRDISEYTFVQLLCQKIRIQTIIAIDFSSSNRPVLINNGLHSGDNHTNLYLGAMNSIFDTLSVFDQNKCVSLYGLCAKIKGVFHEYFPITKTKEIRDKTNPNNNNTERDNKYSSKEDMEDAYDYYRKMLQFWGPTKFSSFLKHVKEEAINANKRDRNVFTVLTIITDGLIVDLHDIVGTISSMTNDPIFIVFVGIGEEKSDRGFLSLKQIDENLSKIKYNSDSKIETNNDIVKFAHFRTENLVEPSSFSKDLFNDIPDEVARFMNQKRNNDEF